MGRFQNDRNGTLRKNLESMPKSVEAVKNAAAVPNYDAKNRQGYDAYKVGDELHFISMLNTLKVEPQFYRSEGAQMKELQTLVEKLALKDPYFVAQCIVWSRCCGESMRSINHIAAALLAPFTSGQEWAKRFYDLFNKKTKNSGGCIYRPDDMAEIKAVYETLSKVPITNAMKKGFAHAIEHLDSYQIFKYKDALIDIINLSHPNPEKSNAVVKATVDGEEKEIKAIVALMKGYKVSADTWEVAQSEAGQEVAKAVKEGKLSETKAKEVLKEAKNDNWESLLKDGKLGILAALRNLNNMLKGGRQEVIDLVCKLISDGDRLRAGKIMPYQIDIAQEILMSENILDGMQLRQVISALETGVELSISNLAEMLPGRNLVIVDASGSMGSMWGGKVRLFNGKTSNSSCARKAGLVAAMIAKSTNADIVYFGGSAHWCNYNPKNGLFVLAQQLERADQGCTNLASAFELITRYNKIYDRIFILSDNECNCGRNKEAYKSYIRNIGNPYIYSVDLASYGTQPIKGDHVHYFFGYGYAMFDAIAQDEFNPNAVIDKIKAIKI